MDITVGVTDEMAADVADFLGFGGPLKEQCAEQIKRLYSMFVKVDCLQLEVNPLAETPEGKVRIMVLHLNFPFSLQTAFSSDLHCGREAGL